MEISEKEFEFFSDGVSSGPKMKQLQTVYYQYKHTEMEEEINPFDIVKDHRYSSINSLPRGIVQPRSDLELKPLWSTSGSRSKASDNVDTIVQKFLAENFTVILFHYDGNVDGWGDLDWSNKAAHIVAQNQTKWWFAKRFLHPDIVAAYDYIFLWDEDLGVENFDPRRYLYIVKKEGFEISQPALDPNSTDIHHKFTIRSRTKKFHRRVYDRKGSYKCTSISEGPPCSGFVEGMAPVFSRSAWNCAWHLIQNDLVHGWGMDMKFGYCAQGDRTKNIGVIDSEYVVHQGIQTLGGGPPTRKPRNHEDLSKKHTPPDLRAEIRRQSTWELEMFKKRWNKAIEEDKAWTNSHLSLSFSLNLFNWFSLSFPLKSKKKEKKKTKPLKMAGRYDSNPFAEDEVNPFSDPAVRKTSGQSKFGGGAFYTTTSGSAPPAAKSSRLSPLPHEPAGFGYDRDAPIDIPLDSAGDLKKKERELQAKEAELKRREQDVKRKEEAAARAGIVAVCCIFNVSRIGSVSSLEYHSCFYRMYQGEDVRIWFLAVIFFIAGVPGAYVCGTVHCIVLLGLKVH
ncbi:hypothetical protein LWI29_002019 [Acer saccharum]|uniref:Uncharacterized protein n=1 Tax=Acer saccharum TaxID=4024 RepID=A0AA39VFC1_ACESA|nr:hypothetical protein LWI29_002019 [Acer saccharum]